MIPRNKAQRAATRHEDIMSSCRGFGVQPRQAFFRAARRGKISNVATFELLAD